MESQNLMESNIKGEMDSTLDNIKVLRWDSWIKKRSQVKETQESLSRLSEPGGMGPVGTFSGEATLCWLEKSAED